jgi:hypothetical protein
MQSLNNDHGLLVWGDSWRKQSQTFNDVIDHAQSISLGGKARGDDSKEEIVKIVKQQNGHRLLQRIHELDMRNESCPIYH